MRYQLKIRNRNLKRLIDQSDYESLTPEVQSQYEPMLFDMKKAFVEGEDISVQQNKIGGYTNDFAPKEDHE